MLLTGAVLGTILGYVLQRGRFCVTGFLRDLWLTKSMRGFTALMLVIAVHAVGYWALAGAGLVELKDQSFAPAATIAGGLIFGYGMVLAGGCATGTWYRAGEGLVGSWLALAAYAATAAFMRLGPLSGFTEAARDRTIGSGTIHGDLGVPPFVPLIALVAVTAWLVYREVSKPKIEIPGLPPRKTGLAHLLAEKPWGLLTTAAIVGALGAIAWPLSQATGRNSGLGITTPSAHLVAWFGTGESEYMNWGTLLVLGILAGSFIAAKASGEFRVRVPNAQIAKRSVGGGVAMGVGAVLAGGCTVGNGMVATGLFSWQGWISLAAMALGAGLAARIYLMRKPLLPTSVRSALARTGSRDGGKDGVKDGAADESGTADKSGTANTGATDAETSKVNA